MANFFKNPLVLAETVVGSMIDQRSLVLYEQPDTIDFTQVSNEAENALYDLVDKNALKELFTGVEVKYVSQINGFNMYGVSYIKGDVEISSDLCDHPTETGSVITDYSVINPITIKVQVAMPTALYTRIYAQMIKYFQQKKYILVQTKFAMYRNMVIQAMPYKLENGTVDRPIVELTLRQIMEVMPQYTDATIDNGDSITNALDGEDNDTVDLGHKTTKVMEKVYKNATDTTAKTA